MLLYFILILIVNIVVVLLNTIFGNDPWWYYMIFSVGATLLEIIIDGIIATLIRKLPEKGFVYENHKYFHTKKGLLRLFEKLGVKKWKDHIPELGGFTDFHKNHVADPKDPKYLERFMLEACYGVLIHEVSYPLGFLVLLLDYRMYYTQSSIWLTVLIPVAITNLILCSLPAITLRYNLPKLEKMKKFAERKSKKEVKD